MALGEYESSSALEEAEIDSGREMAPVFVLAVIGVPIGVVTCAITGAIDWASKHQVEIAAAYQNLVNNLPHITR